MSPIALCRIWSRSGVLMVRVGGVCREIDSRGQDKSDGPMRVYPVVVAKLFAVFRSDPGAATTFKLRRGLAFHGTMPLWAMA